MPGFLNLPRELRDEIYTLTLSYPNTDAVITKAHRQIGAHYAILVRTVSSDISLPQITYAPLKTPTLLLLNHQITSEALLILHRQTWKLSVPAVSEYDQMQDAGKLDQIFKFISQGTIQTMRHVSLEIDFRSGQGFQTEAWWLTVRMLLNCWLLSDKLQDLRVIISNPARCAENGDVTHEWWMAENVIIDVSSSSLIQSVVASCWRRNIVDSLLS